jgi:D-alanyl-D-alanine carboxypeptidase (penicillin-binding protein 5/6)
MRWLEDDGAVAEMRAAKPSEAPVVASQHARRALAYSLTWMLLPVAVFAAFFVTVVRMANADSATRSPGPLDASSAAVSVALTHEPAVQAATAFLFDGDTGEIFYAKDADAERPMASTTKVMTALLAIESKQLDRLVTIGPDAEALAVPGSSRMGVSAGERIRLRDLLYGLLLPSGNDAAIAIADEVGGSEAAFIDLMNARARELGLTHTHYTNPHGLIDDPNHYTSARDLATLEAAALKLPDFVTIASTLHYTIPETRMHKAYDLQTGNDLLSGSRSPYPGALGGKPGYTVAARYTMTFSARRHGHLIVGAVLGDPSWQVRTDDMRALLDWGFAHVGVKPASPPVAWSAPDPNE